MALRELVGENQTVQALVFADESIEPLAISSGLPSHRAAVRHSPPAFRPNCGDCTPITVNLKAGQGAGVVPIPDSAGETLKPPLI